MLIRLNVDKVRVAVRLWGCDGGAVMGLGRWQMSSAILPTSYSKIRLGTGHDHVMS